MAGLWRQILSHKMFTRYLVLTNIFISGGIDGLGDYLEQKLEHQDPVSWARTGRMCVVGLVWGLPDHYWYKFLDGLYPKRTPRVVAKKVVIDTLIMGPLDITVFYLGMCRMEGKTWSESLAELKSKFFTTFLLECAFWPLAQTVNFLFLPTSLRVLYVNMAHLGWAMVLSRLKHQEDGSLPHKPQTAKEDSDR